MQPIPNFEDYKITKTGQVFGKFGKKLQPSLNAKYLHVRLYKNNIQHVKYIHRLVLETFKGPCPPGMEANHKDGNKHNPNINNLEWITCSENHKHAYRIGLKKPAKGEKHPRSKLKENEVWLIRKILKENIITQTYISKIFKISRQTVCDIKKKRKWYIKR